MLGEEYSQKVMRVSVRLSRITGSGLVAVLRMVLAALTKSIDHRTPKKSLRRITRGAAAVESATIATEDVREFQRFARKYNVQFAVVKTSDPAIGDLVFKSRQQGNVDLALSKFLEYKAKAQTRSSVKGKIRAAAAKADAVANNLEIGAVNKAPRISSR